MIVGVRPRGRRGAVVVGHDGSPHAGMAVEYALEQAAARKAGVRVIQAGQDVALAPHPVGYGPLPPDDMGDLTEQLVPWRSKYPEIQITEEAVRGHPVPVLAEASQTACLVVVESRGLGGLTAAVLGSVSHGVLRRARCPVAVVCGPWNRS
ncbi:universal stress protein [Nonomuraea sp. FMUSA5-5]|uniref:Universal stress protein n=1 Tax=Nonomuraea composti TaxID=2720023 RepID=A0ABX1BIH9_9ACTN|nr:universal stress protein [Nonomuraea sp. FMUSA5-5]